MSQPQPPCPSYRHLLLARQGRLLTITLNRPELLNAFGQVMHQELAQALHFAGTDPGSDVVVLTGAGRAFSAGGDIDWMARVVEQPELFDAEAADAKRLVFTLLDIDKPVVAKVNGHAVGLGATLALLCDVIFVADHARIGDPHVAIGLVAGDGGAVIWPQLVGFARAKEYLLTGELLPAATAAQIGLVNHAVPAPELDAAVDAFCQRLLDGATQAIRWTKTTINLELKRIAHVAMDAGIHMEALSVRTADHREAVQAFREKRKPRFGQGRH
jgi:enoyl-CoA hydratase